MVSQMSQKTEIEKLKTANARLKRQISEIKRSNDSLKSEKKILDEILDSLPGTFYIWDERPQLIRWNKLRGTPFCFTVSFLSDLCY